jgi:hypothetical protein
MARCTCSCKGASGEPAPREQPSPGLRLGFDAVVAIQSTVALSLKPDLQSPTEIEAQLARTDDTVMEERLRRRWGVRHIAGDAALRLADRRCAAGIA